ncbi:hypothetical protein OE09_2285 [Flavobacteriaceae bacterium MAR_2010_72]|nr:hypothetical protein OE09_2285 [Flavobacteriaceae bacterium MAR_2010_72]TVZ59005.1 hypothetical protein NA63_1521 [Flavobacteriaceae bacterium MAR_2010_105]
MKLKKLHIVTFDNPNPPNFGGAIDVYYKVKYLSKLGVDIYLHLFFDHRDDIKELHNFCKKIYVYKRNKSLLQICSIIPYRVKSRTSNEIYENLSNIKAPILFEGLQSTQVLKRHNFRAPIFLRAHNLEHSYYFGLAKSEQNILKKLVYKIEGYKFRYYERLINKVDVIFSLSKKENDYFIKNYNTKAYYLPVFHANTTISTKEGSGKYALYHGDLSISDNQESVKFLISVFSSLEFPLRIAGSKIPGSLKRMVKPFKNISSVCTDNTEELITLIREAHVNVLHSNQATGTKIKVFYALFNGRHCIVNDNIIDDNQILSLCEVANTKEEYMEVIQKVFELPYKGSDNRNQTLKQFSPEVLAEQLIDIISKNYKINY